MYNRPWDILAKNLKVLQVTQNFWIDKETMEVQDGELARGVVRKLDLIIKKIIQQENLDLEWNTALDHKVSS